jgi:hypothetical protein
MVAARHSLRERVPKLPPFSEGHHALQCSVVDRTSSLPAPFMFKVPTLKRWKIVQAPCQTTDSTQGMIVNSYFQSGCSVDPSGATGAVMSIFPSVWNGLHHFGAPALANRCRTATSDARGCQQAETVGTPTPDAARVATVLISHYPALDCVGCCDEFGSGGRTWHMRCFDPRQGHCPERTSPWNSAGLH